MILPMKVTVLYGGPSSEREVSLVSGKAVAEGLKQAGHDVFLADITPADLSALDRPCDVIFPALHGDFGESGELQTLLEKRGIKFVGSGSRASSLAIDKLATKQVWQQHGIPTPAWREIKRADAQNAVFDQPAVVKAVGSGSSIDVFVCRDAKEVRPSVEKVLKNNGRVLVEQLIEGVEITVGVLFDKVLEPIKIEPKNEFFDFQSKYTAGGAKHNFDTGLDARLISQIKQTVLRAHRCLGCRHLSRTDVMIDAAGRFYLLEINTMPGFTPVSLLPEMAQRAGIEFSELVDQLVKSA
jgi:D-alanine-D-alanine ligase